MVVLVVIIPVLMLCMMLAMDWYEDFVFPRPEGDTASADGDVVLPAVTPVPAPLALPAPPAVRRALPGGTPGAGAPPGRAS
ncbi:MULTISPECIES: hypothetical protein [Streptomyces]|uniref:hypothetical protein n=1 Tax=Streptomyces TaxID=1883 RepID=UPI001250A47C|nr:MULTISPECIES: hypothetical protein [Streptomyces]NYV77454.1 hypothetical protein [Streptomyces sp. UH6]